MIGLHVFQASDVGNLGHQAVHGCHHPVEAAIADRLRDVAIVRRVILFGSRARGDAAERSDIDLAVDAEGGSPADWQRILDVVDDADTLLKIDAVRLDTLPEDDPLNHAIRRDGIVLFDRGARRD